jgi:glutathione S-transferase
MALRLYQFAASHYNEKARWTLDLKGVPHERVTLMPGPHAPTIKRLTGQTETPVLVDGDQVVAGSSQIIEHLEKRYPTPALYPPEPAERERAFDIQRRFDSEIGPAVRLAKFFEVLDGGYMIDTFCREQGSAARLLYRAAFPIVHRVMKSSMKINAANAAKARQKVSEALDLVASKAGPNGYLVGADFSLADLACAALLMPAVLVTEWGGPPEGESEKNRRWYAAWADHPGAQWVREMYRRHRRKVSGAGGQVAGLSTASAQR